MNHLVNITKSDGTRQLFEEEKLASSLAHVGASPETIDDIVDQVEREMREGMPTSEIYARAFALLKRHSVPIAAKYSLRRALIELGPDGFPFEKFVARIFQAWGYQTVTDQTVRGHCVDHEMDVVAWKGDELAMIEAKFHHEFGIKSDVKVALYIKARFDDLSGQTFTYGGIPRKLALADHWLITNTKFTEQAIKYSSCAGLRLIGWNYPAKGNLHELIESLGLHPITCINTLSHQQKKDLIGHNMLICGDLIKQPEVLRSIGVSEQDVPRIIAEARTVVERAK